VGFICRSTSRVSRSSGRRHAIAVGHCPLVAAIAQDRRSTESHRPRVRITAKDVVQHLSRRPVATSGGWRDGRFSMCIRFATALFDQSYTLDRRVQDLKIPGKLDSRTNRPNFRRRDHVLPWRRARDGRCPQRTETRIYQHPLTLAGSSRTHRRRWRKPISTRWHFIPPRRKFEVSEDIYALRCRRITVTCGMSVRRLEVPHRSHRFHQSQYPTVNALLGNWRVLTAERVTFEDATEEVRAFSHVRHSRRFVQLDVWTQLSFFALVEPDDDIFPVRAV